MKNTSFKVRIDFDDSTENGERKYNNNGLDRVEFMISTNAGEPLNLGKDSFRRRNVESDACNKDNSCKSGQDTHNDIRRD